MGLGHGAQTDEDHFVERGEPQFYVFVEPPAPKTPYYGAPVNNAQLTDAKAKLAQGQRDYAAIAKKLETPNLPQAEFDDLTAKKATYLQVLASLSKQIAEADAKLAAYNKNPPKPPPAPPPPSHEELDLSQDVLSFEYQESEKKTDQLKLTLENQDLRYFDHIIFEKGTKLRVSWGYAGAMSPPRAVVVQSVKGSLTLQVEAQGGGVLMNKVARSRSFDGKTRADVVRQIAKENGYGENEQYIEDTQQTHAVISQAAQTDAQFLKRLADLEHFEFFVDFDGLHWHPRRFGHQHTNKGSEHVLEYYLPPDVGDIVTFNVENDVTAKPGKVEVKGRDPLKKADLSAKGSDVDTKRDTLAKIPEVKAGPDAEAKRTAPVDIALKVDPRTGEMKETVVDGVTDLKPTTATDATTAKKQADGAFKRSSQAAVELTLNLVGDPNLVAKTVVEVRGLGKRLSGKYYIHELTHKIDSSGYTMAAKTKTDGGNHGANKPTSAKAKTNDKNATAKSSEELTEVAKVDPRTGEVKTQFVDTRGRDSAAPPAEAPAWKSLAEQEKAAKK